MGSFSWTRANLPKNPKSRSNITAGDKYKILVPEKFGGGYITDYYFDYGKINYEGDAVYVDGAGNAYTSFGESDLYGILSIWNSDEEPAEEPNSETVDSMLEILRSGNAGSKENRNRGIKISKTSRDIENLKYPLKLVSLSFRGTYESCTGVSYDDPCQGFAAASWDNSQYGRYLEKLKEREKAAGVSRENDDKTEEEAPKEEREFLPGDVVRHFKWSLNKKDSMERYLYVILGFAEYTESGEKLVIYQNLGSYSRGGKKLYARPYGQFCSKVDRNKYPEAEQEYRFEKLKNNFNLKNK